MPDRKTKLPKVPELKPKADAFDLWLQRGLHELFDEVVKEPIPPDLLKLIEDGRPK